MRLSRRTILQSTLGGVLASQLPAFAAPKRSADELSGRIGVTTGSFMRHLTIQPQRGKLRLLDLPKIMSDDLNMQVIDLMTATLASFEPAYLDNFRNRAEKSGCIITNLKMNQKGLDMASSDQATRASALAVYKSTIDSAQRLGCRWVRPAPTAKQPDMKIYADSYRRLIDYAAPKGITLLIENNGWMRGDPSGIPRVVRAVGPGLDASVDTGNWTNQARYAGLAKAFPLAVTCDFKAFALGPRNEHPPYDLKRCFQAGWDAGYRGPWCLEHFNDTLAGLFGGFATLRDMLKQWTKEAMAP